MALTDTAIKALKPKEKQRKVADGGSLYLLVKPNGSKLWNMAYTFAGKQKVLSFGAYPVVSLAEARKKRDQAKRQLGNGFDPIQQAKSEKLARRITFESVAQELLAKVEREGKAPTTVAKKRWLLEMSLADIGTRPIAEISSAEILVPLRKVEAKGNYETARRMRSTIGQVFRYAIATARAANDPTSGLKGALTTPVVTHRSAITNKKPFGGLLRAIWSYEGAAATRHALMLMAYLYPRPGELRLAEWPEFDLDAAIWTIPAHRTKMRREHKKPLSEAALSVLRLQHALTKNNRFVFPSLRSHSIPISENTLNGALRRLGFKQDEMTSHGFRASASSLLNESGRWSVDAIEVELAHIGADMVRRAYHRAAYWDERLRMADWWSEEVDTMREQAP
jgi:integrase